MATPLLRAGLILAALWCGACSALPAHALVRIGLPAIPDRIDPHLAVTRAEQLMAEALFAGLVSIDGQGRPAPGLARTWSVSADGLVYRFVLRPDAAWSDGRKLKAEDVVASFARALDPATAAPFAALLFNIRNVQSYRLGILAPGETLGVRATGDDTVEIALSAPSRDFLAVLAQPLAAVVAVPARDGVGSGPFVRAGPQRLRAAGAGGLDEIDLVAYADEDAARADIAKGTLTAALGFAPSTYRLIAHVGHSPLGSRDARHALGMVIDRSAAAAAVAGGHPLYTTHTAPSYDALQAPYAKLRDQDRRIVAAALLLDVDRGSAAPLRLAVPLGRRHERLAAGLAEAWRALGFGVEIVARAADAHERALLAGDFDIATAPGWSFPGLPGGALLALSQAAGPWNAGHYRDSTFERYLAAADIEADAAASLQQLREADAVLVADQPVWPVFALREEPPALREQLATFAVRGPLGAAR